LEKREIETFEQAVEYLFNMPKFTAKNSLQDTRKFLHLLGNPDQRLHIIHVAGTNGKGSVCAYLRAILEESGKKVAVFTSPHLVDIRERFMIEGKNISREEFMDTFLQVYNSLDFNEIQKGTGYHPAFFEYLFFMAMLFFAKNKPDYCILETGLGGRLDATNAVMGKDLTIITRIGFDHVEYLGSTLTQIAGEKAGILKTGVPVVYWDSEDDTADVFLRKARELQIPAYPVSKNDYTFLNFNNKTIDFSFKSRYYNYISLSLNTIASYQMENAALAVRGIEILDQERSITVQMIKNGIRKCHWPGRMEEVLPEVYVDGAHNEDGIRAFLDTVRNDGMSGRRKLLFSVLSDKNYENMLTRILESGCFHSMAIARMQTERAVSPEDIEKIIQRYPGCAYTFYKDTGTAFHELLTGQEGERIYVAGSLYLAGEIKEYLEHDKF